MNTTKDTLSNSGGVQNNPLKNLLKKHDDSDDDEQIEIITHSPYYFDDLNYPG